VEYATTLKLYPLAEAASPRPTGWFDVTRVKGYFHGNPHFGLDSFKLIEAKILVVDEPPSFDAPVPRCSSPRR
jgi:hypothetical protein